MANFYSSHNFEEMVGHKLIEFAPRTFKGHTPADKKLLLLDVNLLAQGEEIMEKINIIKAINKCEVKS